MSKIWNVRVGAGGLVAIAALRPGVDRILVDNRTIEEPSRSAFVRSR